MDWEKAKEMPYCPTEEDPGCVSASQALSPHLRLQLHTQQLMQRKTNFITLIQGKPEPC